MTFHCTFISLDKECTIMIFLRLSGVYLSLVLLVFRCNVSSCRPGMMVLPTWRFTGGCTGSGSPDYQVIAIVSCTRFIYRQAPMFGKMNDDDTVWFSMDSETVSFLFSSNLWKVWFDIEKGGKSTVVWTWGIFNFKLPACKIPTCIYYATFIICF